jgi:hypothetical protein
MIKPPPLFTSEEDLAGWAEDSGIMVWDLPHPKAWAMDVKAI